MKMPLTVWPTTRFQIRNNIINEKIKQLAGWCIFYMLILIMKMQHSANYMVHTRHINIDNEGNIHKN